MSKEYTYQDAMAITDQAEADEYFQAFVAIGMAEGQSRDKAESIQRSNLGYFAGYYSHETRIRVERLFRCSHPVFGSVSNGIPTAEEAFKAGLELGTK